MWRQRVVPLLEGTSSPPLVVDSEHRVVGVVPLDLVRALVECGTDTA